MKGSYGFCDTCSRHVNHKGQLIFHLGIPQHNTLQYQRVLAIRGLLPATINPYFPLNLFLTTPIAYHANTHRILIESTCTVDSTSSELWFCTWLVVWTVGGCSPLVIFIRTLESTVIPLPLDPSCIPPGGLYSMSGYLHAPPWKHTLRAQLLSLILVGKHWALSQPSWYKHRG